MQKIWNERYAAYDNLFGTEPNSFFKQELDKLTPGTLLLPGEGEGRNAIYGEQNGWLVTAFDSSDIAIEKAMKNAAAAGVDFDYIHADTTSFATANNSQDAIALVFLHLPPEQRIPFHKNIVRWLKPGGTLIVEAFNPLQINRESGGPKDFVMLYTEDMLRSDFYGLNITLLHTCVSELNEGAFHSGAAELVRMVAQKPA